MPKPVTLISCALLLVGCSRTEKISSTESPKPDPKSNAVSEPAGPSIDPCALLTAEDLEAVQGEPIQEVKPSPRTENVFAVSQCYFSLPTATNSVVVTVTQKASGPNARDPREYWAATFHGEKVSGGEREEEEKEKKAPLAVDGVGDEAFWTGNAVGGALYVLKGNSFVRISVGGAGDANAKIEKSKALAAKILTHQL